jgi:hypothetical protein
MYIGQQFGLLTIISERTRNRFGQAERKVRCSCGNEKSMQEYHIKSGQSRSCGCQKNMRRNRLSPSVHKGTYVQGNIAGDTV